MVPVAVIEYTDGTSQVFRPDTQQQLTTYDPSAGKVVSSLRVELYATPATQAQRKAGAPLEHQAG